jgi:hypothetical protein
MDNPEQLDHLQDEIDEARRHLNERTHQEKPEPEFFKDDQEVPEEPPGS